MNEIEIESLVASRHSISSVPDTRFSPDDSNRLMAFFGNQLPREFIAMRSLLPRYNITGDHLPVDEMIRDYHWECENNPNFTPDHVPFYAIGNGDYLCLSRAAGPSSPVLYVAHDDPEVMILHPTFIDYLKDADWFSEHR